MQNGETALLYATQYGHFDIADILLRHGASVQHENKVIRGKDSEGVSVFVGKELCFGACYVRASI